MRMRKKKNLDSRLSRVSHLRVDNPESLRGEWIKTHYPPAEKMYLELGCGQGGFSIGLAERNPTALVIAVERVENAIVVGMERTAGLSNLFYLSRDVSGICSFFAPGEVDRIYINFCDPWPHWKQAHKRLIARGFLYLYSQVLKPGGGVHFKTDNAPLYEFALKEFRESGYEIITQSCDLPRSDNNIETEFERKFRSQGIPIHYVHASRVLDINSTNLPDSISL